MRNICCVVVVVGVFILGGCSKPEAAKKISISGEVTLDKKALEEGVIIFTKDGEIPQELPIKSGKYEGQVFVGKNHVQFAVYKSPKRKQVVEGPGSNEESMENILPAKYHQESTEFCEVKDGTGNKLNFDLLSK